jgi:hypothetical protein
VVSTYDAFTGTGVTGVTYDGVAMTQAATKSQLVSATLRNYVYYLKEASLSGTGSKDCVASITNDNTVMALAVYALEGVDQTTTIGATGTAGTDAAVTSSQVSLTTTADASWVVDGLTLGSANNAAPDASQTERVDIIAGSTYGHQSSTKPVATAGATTVDWTFSSSAGYAATAVEVLQATASAGKSALFFGWMP